MKFRLTIICILFLSFTYHKFYFSETLLEWKEPNFIQITIKTFADDWSLATSSEAILHSMQLDSLYMAYLNEHFTITTSNHQPLQLQYIGHEKEGEFLYLYLETQTEKMEKLNISQQILTELFPDQKNLVNYRFNGNTKSLYFFKDSSPQLLQWP